MVRSAERTNPHQGPALLEQTRDGMDLCGSQRLFQRKVGEDCRETLGQHRLPRTGGTHEQDVVAPGRRYLQSPLHMLLSLHSPEVD